MRKKVTRLQERDDFRIPVEDDGSVSGVIRELIHICAIHYM